MARVLLVEDDRNARRMLARAIARGGHDVETAASPDEARAQLQGGRFAVVITDLRMEGRDAGLEVLAEARRLQPEARVMLLTAYASTETAVAAMKQGAFDYLSKPVSQEDLLLAIERALGTGRSRRREARGPSLTRTAVAGADMLVGASPVMQRVRERLFAAARSDCTVLITGESGTGKELAARFVHAHSRRAKGPFVAINCGAIPETLFESELFGHRKGAFTDAHADQPGVFEEAAGGTLFLDEVGELPLSVQVKLLRALQERRIRRVGEVRERPVDVRVIAATNRDLAAEVQKGRFREDLFFRLNVLPVVMPPLRVRREDVPAIARALLARWGEDPERLQPEVAMRLSQLPLRGNVRELENLLMRMLALAPPGGSLTQSVFEEALAIDGTGMDAPPADDWEAIRAQGLDAWLEAQERRALERALTEAGGSLTRAAELLGISFRSMRYRVAKLGLRETR